ncbi:MAG: ATP-binding cassette domain-containing protein [Acutalibacteraceae bacterium]
MKITEVILSFGGQTVMEKFSLALPKQGLVALMGPSGAGKTTLLRVMMGLETPQSGRVDTENAKVALLFQEDRLLPWLTARQNVEAVLDPNEKQQAAKALGSMGLEEQAWDKLPEELSGGMRRRVALARLICYGGDVWLMDEAFKGLDRESRDALIPFFKQQAETRLIVLVTHEKEDAVRLGAQIIELEGPPLKIK